MELKWILAIGLEVAFWLLLTGFLVLRYWFGFERVTRWFVIATVIDTLAIVGLGVWDLAVTGEVSGYTMFIAALLVYAFVWGKKDLMRLDAWMARRTQDLRRRRPARQSA